MRILYTPSFVRQYDQLPRDLQDEVRERIALFRENPRNPQLRTRKLKGVMSGKSSFRVNYKYRIIFCYDTKDTVALLAVGDHDVYN